MSSSSDPPQSEDQDQAIQVPLPPSSPTTPTNSISPTAPLSPPPPTPIRRPSTAHAVSSSDLVPPITTFFLPINPRRIDETGRPYTALPHVRSHGHIGYPPISGQTPYGMGYSVTASARTSFTRVEDTIGPYPLLGTVQRDDSLYGDQGEEFGEEVRNEEIAIGVLPDPPVPESGEQQQPQSDPIPQTPATFLTFLLLSGRRRTMSFEPETTIGRVKELFWSGWGTDWDEERPPAPSYLRVVYLGKILQDDDTLKDLNFPISIPTLSPQVCSTPTTSIPPPTIVHLSIRPCAPLTDDMLKKKRGRLSARIVSLGIGVGVGGREGGDVAARTGRREVEEAQDDGHGAGGCCSCVIC